MASITLRALRRLPVTALALLGGLALMPTGVHAQLIPTGVQTQRQVGGSGFGGSVTALGVTTRSPVATLPSDGGYQVGEAETFGVPNAVQAQWLTAVTTGSVATSSEPASAQTISEVENVSVLNGLIQADNVTAIASSYANGGGAGSNADGSGFVNLVVNGAAVTTDVAPNTRISLPLVGYAVLNEQIQTGDGVTSSGITVNMIHVYLLNGDEIIVGSASSRVTP